MIVLFALGAAFRHGFNSFKDVLHMTLDFQMTYNRKTKLFSATDPHNGCIGVNTTYDGALETCVAAAMQKDADNWLRESYGKFEEELTKNMQKEDLGQC